MTTIDESVRFPTKEELTVGTEAKSFTFKDFSLKDSGQADSLKPARCGICPPVKDGFDLIPPQALSRLAVVFEKGAEKYGENNWRKGIPESSYLDSALRHINRYQLGAIDEDHLIQAVWNLMCLVETQYLIKQNLLPEKPLND
jgi:hypothetical protein